MTGKGDGLFGDAFLQAAIAVEGEDVVVEDGVIGGVELGRGAFAGEREADRIADTLAEWPSGGFDARGVAELRDDPVFRSRARGSFSLHPGTASPPERCSQEYMKHGAVTSRRE